MARRSTKGSQTHPSGAVISLSDTQRGELRTNREALGWKQEDLAKRVRVAPATISNVESGRSKQVRKSVYLRIIRALKMGPASPVDEESDRAYFQLADILPMLGDADVKVILGVASSLAEKSKKTT